MGNCVVLLFSVMKSVVTPISAPWAKIVTDWQLMSREEKETGAVLWHLQQIGPRHVLLR